MEFQYAPLNIQKKLLKFISFVDFFYDSEQIVLAFLNDMVYTAVCVVLVRRYGLIKKIRHVKCVTCCMDHQMLKRKRGKFIESTYQKFNEKLRIYIFPPTLLGLYLLL